MQRLITSKYVLPLIVLVTIIILYDPFSHQTFASSPSFALQGIKDDLNDWSLSETNSLGFNTAKNITECTAGQQQYLPDISAVNYFSDGKALNTTLWLSSPFEQPSSQRVRSYALLIDVHSAYDIGQDYQVIINWDGSRKAWNRIIEASSPTPGENRIIDPGENKIVDQKNNYTGFSVKGKNYVDLSLDLTSISSPNQYSIVFIASEIFFVKSGGLCSLVDITDLVHIPPPEFTISASPSSVILRPGQEKNMELQLKSASKLNAHALLSTDQIPSIRLKFIPNDIRIPPNGLVTVPLNVKVLENATVRPYTLPIFANISFPTTVTNRLSGGLLSNSPSARIIENSDFAITVTEPLSIPEYINNTLNTYGSPIKEIITLATVIGSVGGLSTWIAKRIRTKKK